MWVVKMRMNRVARLARRAGITAIILLSSLPITPAIASGDLLVAPTRIVLDGRRGAEVILNNIGSEEATYRISLELRRMSEIGRLEDVDGEGANDREKAALEMIRYAPRRVTLPPNQPQSIRIGVRPEQALPDGEYRVHMLFRAIPMTESATAAPEEAGNGLQIQLIPIYGVTIPIIVRKGNLEAVAAIANPRMTYDNEGPTLHFDMTRNGDRSVYGDIRVNKAGTADPILVAKGIAVYPERDSRSVSLPMNEETAALMKGNVTIGYYETQEAGGGLIAEVRTVLN